MRAFRTAAKAVRGLGVDPAQALADGTLAATKGVGPATVGIVKELVTVGRCELLEQLREDIPPGMVEMLRISGLGVTRIRTIHEQLRIETLAELEDAARDGRLAALSGLRCQDRRNGPQGHRASCGGSRPSGSRTTPPRRPELLRAALERLPGVSRAIVAGEVRRRSEVVRDLVMVLVAEVPAGRSLPARWPRCPDSRRSPERMSDGSRCASPGGMVARIVVTPPVNLGAVLVQATGSAAHLERLAAHAASLGFGLNAAALWKGSDFVPTPDEAALYGALGLAEIPPELREGRDEVERPERDRCRACSRTSDLAGLLHCHTKYSDGNLTVAELAAACREAGYAYVGITDHSKSAAYAGGLSPRGSSPSVGRGRCGQCRGRRDPRPQGDRVGHPRGRHSSTTTTATLAGFDFVIASIHSRFAMVERR